MLPLNPRNSVVQKDLDQIIRRIPEEQWFRLAGKTAVITGANGFIGSWLTALLSRVSIEVLSDPCQIVAVDLVETPLGEICPHVTAVALDITGKWNAIPRFDYLIFSAGIASPIAYRQKPFATLNVTVDGLRQAYEHALSGDRCSSILFMSTSEIYGNPPADQIPTKEDFLGLVQTMGPRACYDESKRLGETLSFLYNKHKGLPIKVARPFNVFGPGLSPDDGRVVADFLKDVLAGEGPSILSDGSPTRTFCYIQDAVVALMLILFSELEGEAFNVGANTGETSMLDLARVFTNLLEGKTEHDFQHSSDVDYLKDNPQRRRPDLTKISQELGYSHQVSLQSGVQRYYQYYSNPDDG